MKPYYQGKGITLYLGDCIRVLETLADASADAFITDPPYSSGGLFRSDRAATPAAKYVQHGVRVLRPSFSGDNRDGRSWATWCTIWLSECRRIVKPAGYALMFSDWRQLPLASDAFQWGGFVWRGLIAWDKTEAARAPHTGYFRHQCEYVVWGSNGTAAKAHGRGPWAGAIRTPVLQADKYHITGKPTAVMPAEASPEFQYAATERRRVLMSAFDGMAGKQISLIRLRYSRGMTFLEIAGEFGVVESAVHAMHGRILRALRDRLREQGIRSFTDIF